MKQPPQEVGNQHLAEFLKRVVAADASAPIPDLEQLIEAVGLDNASPWYGQYCKEFYRMLRFGNHEAIDHPVACLLVLPSTFEGEASSCFADLFEEKATPLLKQLVRESHAVLHYVFLHDAQIAEKQVHAKAVATLQSLTSSSLGPSGHVLTINSGGMPRVPPTTWQEYVNQRWEGGTAEKKSKIAAGMSQADATSIATAIEELAARKVAPHVESRIRYLDQTAMSARKGFKNQLKTLLFRKSAAATSTPHGSSKISPRSTSNDGGAIKGSSAGGSGSSSSPRSPRSPTSRSATQYSLTSVEAQLQQLGNLALMVGDCDTALSVFRLLASDYKSDKAYFHYAGVQEAMAVATVLYDGPPSDAISNFKEAFYRYDQVAQQAQQQQQGGGGPPSRATWYATRVSMRMASYLKALGRYADASYIVMKAHFAEEDLRAALLIEQAALLLLRVEPARVRKFAFHLVLAGLRYSKGGARDLAARSYSLAFAVYKGRDWDVVEEHVREALGKGCREIGDSLGAVEHFAATLTCSQIPAGLQSLHMAQFAESLQAAIAQLGYQPVIQLPLPVVNTSKVGVSSSGQASYANGAARQAVPELWINLQSAVCQGLAAAGGDSRDKSINGGDRKGSSTWLDNGGSKASLASAAGGFSRGSEIDNLCCCVGEDIGVDVEITNPLQIELAVTKFKLTCTFEAAASIAPAPAAPPAAVGFSSPFQVKEERITLHPGEQAVVHLRVKPLRTGSLTIDGVSWELNGIATSTRAFTIKRGGNLGFVTLNRYPDAEDTEKDVVVTTDDVFSGLIVKIMPPMPRLELSLETLPPTLLVGQVSKCNLKLKNAGAMTLHALRCAIDTASVFLELGAGQQVVHKPGKGHVFGLPTNSSTKLGVNEEMEVVLYVRPTQPGPFSFSMCWYYEPLVKLEALPYRTLRATFSANALPSLEMTAWSGPLAGSVTIAARGENGSACDSKEKRMLVLRGLNLQGIESFILKELEIFGGGGGNWKAVLAGKQKEEEDGSGAMSVKLGHVVGPESAVVLHAILSSSSLPSSLSTSSSSTQNDENLLSFLSTPQQYLADGEANLQSKTKTTSTASVGKEKTNTAAAPAAAEPSHVVLHWEATGLSEDIVHGFNVIPIFKFKEGLGLAARLVAPQRSIKHNFSISPICGIELALEICHEIPAALDVKWSTTLVRDSTTTSTTGATAAQGEQSMLLQGATRRGDDDNDDGISFAQQQQAVSSPQRFTWHGATQAALHDVTPGNVVRVPLRLSVLSPGWVSIDSCWVNWRCKDAPDVDGELQIPACHFYVGEGGL
jgi:tetratricopeptide (TPR) repeat protein